MIVAVWLLVVAACGGPTDRSRYVEAASAPADQALALCARVRDVPLRGECLGMVAARVAREQGYEPAAAACARIDDVMWREECHFLAADEAALIGDDAVRACKAAGRWRHNCVGHAIGREVEALEKRHGAIGQEAILVRRIEELVKRYKPGAPEDQRRATSDTLVARTLAARWQEGPFDARLCGTALPALCARAYRTSLDATPREVGVHTLCGGPITREAVAAVGARGWADGSEALALEAWRTFCDDLASGAVSREADRQMGLGPRGQMPEGFPGGAPP